MMFFLLIASYVAYKVSYVGAENWNWGVGPIVAAISGIAGSFIVSFGIAIAMDSLAPQQSALELLMPALRASSYSLFISPVSAFYGWRNSRLSNKPSSVVETTHSDERDGLEPEWVNSRDDLESELENNEEAQRIDAETVKTAHPWNKKLLIGWGVLSILWVTSMGNILTDFDENIYDLETVILNVEIGSPRVKKHEDSAYKSKKLDFSGLHWFSIKRLKPDSTELSKAKNKFPHLKGMTNSEFSDHLWGLVQREAIENLAQRKESFESRRLSKYISSVVIPPTTVFILGSILVWGLRKYPPRAWNLRKYLPSELTPYTKKVIVASAVWIMGAICWFMIEEGLDDGENVLVYILPPLVLIVAAILWKWANKSPTDVPRQSGVDRTK